MNKKLYVDMDGTVAVFKQAATLTELFSEGYFKDLRPQESVIEAVKRIYDDNLAEVFILSSYLSTSLYAIKEKNLWLDKYMPWIDRSHRIFIQCGASKAQYIADTTGLNENTTLLDDYSYNLHQWEAAGGANGAKAIKLLNGINGKNGTWNGARISIGDMSGLKDMI